MEFCEETLSHRDSTGQRFTRSVDIGKDMKCLKQTIVSVNFVFALTFLQL